MLNFMICGRLRHVRAAVSLTISAQNNRLFSSSLQVPNSVSNSSTQNPFCASYLINSCGFTPEKALIASNYLKFKTPRRPDSVLSFLQSHGFTKTQVSNLVRKDPGVLKCVPETNFLPKFEFLSSLGLSRTDLAKILTIAPGILTRSLENFIIPRISFLRNLLRSNEKMVTAIKRYPYLLSYDIRAGFVHNIQILRELGVPESNIVSSASSQPRVFMAPADVFRSIVERVKELGFDPLTVNFLLAICALKSMSESTWKKKVDLYKEWGLSEEEIMLAFRKYPFFMVTSMDKTVKIMDFLVNQIGLKNSIIMKRPQIFFMNLERRIAPRCLVYQILLEKGLIEKNKYTCFRNCLEVSEMTFHSMIRKNYEKDACELLKLYQEKLDLVK